MSYNIGSVGDRIFFQERGSYSGVILCIDKNDDYTYSVEVKEDDGSILNVIFTEVGIAISVKRTYVSRDRLMKEQLRHTEGTSISKGFKNDGAELR